MPAAIILTMALRDNRAQARAVDKVAKEARNYATLLMHKPIALPIYLTRAAQATMELTVLQGLTACKALLNT
jgi:hypothetical protein